MHVLAHWIARAPTGDNAARVLDTAQAADEYREIGWTVTGPFVPADDAGAVQDRDHYRRAIEAHRAGNGTLSELDDALWAALDSPPSEGRS